MKISLEFRKLCLRSILYSSLIIVPSKSHASFICILNTQCDTSGQSKNSWKKSESEFLNIYGKDDSSRALIRFFFDRRKLARRLMIIPVAIDLTLALTLGIYGLTSMGLYLNYLWGSAVLFLAFASITLFIVAAGTWMRYSRKRLYHILTQYESGVPLPQKWARKNRFFKRFMLQGK
jgi:hypothetical protein